MSGGRLAVMPQLLLRCNPPRESVIDQRSITGPANEIIEGLGGIAGMQDVMGAVVMTVSYRSMDLSWLGLRSLGASRVDMEDENGERVQRTVRTRVERIAVTGDMDLDGLRAIGFEVVAGYGPLEEVVIDDIDDDVICLDDEEPAADAAPAAAASHHDGPVIAEVASTPLDTQNEGVMGQQQPPPPASTGVRGGVKMDRSHLKRVAAGRKREKEGGGSEMKKTKKAAAATAVGAATGKVAKRGRPKKVEKEMNKKRTSGSVETGGIVKRGPGRPKRAIDDAVAAKKNAAVAAKNTAAAAAASSAPTPSTTTRQTRTSAATRHGQSTSR